MNSVAVLDDYDGSISKLDCWGALSKEFRLDFFSAPKSPRELADYEVIVATRERTIMTREFLGHAKNLKHLALTGRLSGQADLDTLKERDIAVSFTEGSGSSAAELTIGLILGITKGLHERHNTVVAGSWQRGLGISLSGKTLGVLGLGRIGSKVAMFGNLMDMKVVSWGPTSDAGRQEKYSLRRMELNECLRQSDVLAICLRLSEKTRDLLGAKELALLKDGAYLVNTSRAEIIQKHALYTELNSGRIFGAFDVFHEEPLPVEDPIRKFPTVLLSPHMGYVTQDVYKVFFSQVVENILAWKHGNKFKNALTLASG